MLINRQNYRERYYKMSDVKVSPKHSVYLLRKQQKTQQQKTVTVFSPKFRINPRLARWQRVQSQLSWMQHSRTNTNPQWIVSLLWSLICGMFTNLWPYLISYTNLLWKCSKWWRHVANALSLVNSHYYICCLLMNTNLIVFISKTFHTLFFINTKKWKN